MAFVLVAFSVLVREARQTYDFKKEETLPARGDGHKPPPGLTEWSRHRTQEVAFEICSLEQACVGRGLCRASGSDRVQPVLQQPRVL